MKVNHMDMYLANLTDIQWYLKMPIKHGLCSHTRLLIMSMFEN